MIAVLLLPLSSSASIKMSSLRYWVTQTASLPLSLSQFLMPQFPQPQRENILLPHLPSYLQEHGEMSMLGVSRLAIPSLAMGKTHSPNSPNQLFLLSQFTQPYLLCQHFLYPPSPERPSTGPHHFCKTFTCHLKVSA